MNRNPVTACARAIALSLALLFALPAAATSVNNVKINRVRYLTSSNDLYFQVTVPPGTLDCVGSLVALETYVVDTDTDIGRLFETQILAAYSSGYRVNVIGTGACRTLGVSPFTTRYETVSTLTVF